jgi:hypothetical protein
VGADVIYIDYPGGVVSDDPYYGDTILILNCEQPDGSTTFLDTCPYENSVAAIGGIDIQGQYGSFDGVDDFVRVQPNEEWHIGSDDFTAEADANFASLPGLWTIITHRAPNAGVPDSGFLIIGNSTGVVQATVWGHPAGIVAVVIANIVSAAGAVTTGQHHICLQRSGSNFWLSVDGVLVGSDTSSDPMGDGYRVQVGNDESATLRFFHGSMRVRVTRGVARYPSFPFTPDPSPYPDPT